MVTVAGLLVTDAYQRLSPSAAAADSSVLNRIEIWKSSLAMLGGAPLSGWGSGSSPSVYSNWFQEVSSPIDYISLVSSYLDFGLDHGAMGIWLLGSAIIWMICFPLALLSQPVLSLTGSGRVAMRAIYTSGLGVCVLAANVPSSFAAHYWPFLFPMVAYAILTISAGKDSGYRVLVHPLLYAATGAAVVTLLLLGMSLWIAGRGDIVRAKAGSARIVLRHRTKLDANERIRLVYDGVALGISPGKLIRRWFVATAPATTVETELYPYVTDDLVNCSQRPTKVVAFGKACTLVSGLSWSGKVVLVFPSDPPPIRGPLAETTICLPGTDELGLNQSWVEWATRFHAKTVLVQNSGLVVQMDFNPLTL